MKPDRRSVANLVRRALSEDVGPGDITTARTVSGRSLAGGEIVAKEGGVIAGLEVAREVYRQVDGRIRLENLIEEGQEVETGASLVLVQGPARGILTAERTALNFLQRLSGIATMTRQYVLAVAGTGATILDTRKTTPGLRSLEKYAVRLGGGSNHRLGLFDMVLIKDNHLHLVGDVKKAIALGRKGGEKVEVEVRTMEGVREAVEAGADRIMLDNMSLDSMRQAVSYIKRRAGGKGRIEVEASGGIGLATVRQVAATGVDSISVGALTHSCRALDIAFYLR